MKNKLLLIAMGVMVSAQTLMAQVPSYVPTQGLVNYYPFIGNANDATNNGNNGVVNGAVLTSDKNGNSNSAYLFNGSSNNIGIPQPFLGGVQVNSFSFYTRFKTNGTPTDVYNIWGKTFNWGEVNFCVNNQNKIDFTWANSNTGNTYSYGISTDAIIPNSWCDLFITYENSNIKIYLNGNLSITVNGITAQGGGIVSTTSVNSLCNFAQDANSNKIGSRITGGNTGRFFNGIIDDFGVWNRALTQQEITTMYNGSQASSYTNTCNNVSGSLTQGLVGYWPFCGNANDDSGNGNNGTVNGATLTTDRFGNTNSAYSFNGTNNYIQIGNSSEIDTMNDFTISTWYSTNTISPQFQHLVSKDFIGAPPTGDWDLFLNYGKVKFDITLNNSNNFGLSNSNISENTWYNIVITRNSTSGEIKTYINGIVDNTFIGYSGIYSNNQSLNFGRQGSSNQHFLNGKLDDIGIWNRVLSQAEVTQLYNQNQCFNNTTVTDTLIINVGQLSYTNPITYSNNITIAPNPASTQININFNNITDLNGGTIKIINSLGQQVATTPITVSGTNTSMQLETWGGAGMYFVQIINPQGQIVDIKKIILQ